MLERAKGSKYCQTLLVGMSIRTNFLEGNLAKGLRSLKNTDTFFTNLTSKHFS